MAQNITQEQLSILIDFVEIHGDISNYLVKSTHTKGLIKRQRLLRKLVNSLNHVNFGPKKVTEKWIKTWTDLKHRTKKKQVMIDTGGGSRQSTLSDYENRILSIMNQRRSTQNKTQHIAHRPTTGSPFDKVTSTFAATEEKRLKLEEERDGRYNDLEIKRLELDILREKNFHERELLNGQIKKDSIAVQQQLVSVLNKFLDLVNNR